MRLLGTIDEWLQHKPKANLRNDSILGPKGMYLFSVKDCHDKPITATFPTGRANGTEPMIYIGARGCCPYMERGTFNYTCGVASHEWATGHGGYLSDRQAADPNWYEWNHTDYEAYLDAGGKSE